MGTGGGLWEAIRELRPSETGALPENLVKELEEAGCSIPQLGEPFPEAKRPHNFVKGTFSASGETDWAILCSRGGKRAVVEYEPDSELRDTEQVPLLENGGIEAFIKREVLPHAEDAWYDESSVKIGYEVSFTRYFYKPQAMRPLDDIRAEILAVEKETEGLLAEIVGRGGRSSHSGGKILAGVAALGQKVQ